MTVKPSIEFKHITKTVEWALISGALQGKRAKKSGLPLMNHINEGLTLLVAMGAEYDTLKAFLMHPLVESRGPFGDLEGIVRGVESLPTWDLVCQFKKLTMELTRIRHSSREAREKPSNWRTHYEAVFNERRKAPILTQIALLQLLLADKIQNLKDLHMHTWDVMPIGGAEHLDEHLGIVITMARKELARAEVDLNGC